MGWGAKGGQGSKENVSSVFFFQKRRQYIIASNDKKSLNFSTFRIESDRKVKAIIEKSFKKVKSVKQKL